MILFAGVPLTDHEMVDIHYNKMASLQVSFRVLLYRTARLYRNEGAKS